MKPTIEEIRGAYGRQNRRARSARPQHLPSDQQLNDDSTVSAAIAELAAAREEIERKDGALTRALELIDGPSKPTSDLPAWRRQIEQEIRAALSPKSTEPSLTVIAKGPVVEPSELEIELSEAMAAELWPESTESVAPKIQDAICARCGGVYSIWPTMSRECGHCGHSPVEIIDLHETKSAEGEG